MENAKLHPTIQQKKYSGSIASESWASESVYCVSCAKRCTVSDRGTIVGRLVSSLEASYAYANFNC